MPDDHRQDEPRKIRPQDMSVEELRDISPDDLPRYEDPAGRTILPRHRRRAMRECAAIGIDALSVDHALHICAAHGIDVFSGTGPTMLGVAADAGRDDTRDEEAADGRREGGGLPAEMRREDGGQSRALTRRKNDDADLPAARGDGAGKDLARMPSEAEVAREKEIAKIQRGLVRRRRQKLISLALRLIVFVLLPTAAVGYYFFNIATPMYATESEFVIQTSDSPASSAGLGGLLAGTGFATSQDSIVVQGYLGSREAFRRLNDDFGYIEHFQNPAIDPIQRLASDATLDVAYDYYQDKVIIGYDPTEGIIRMTVIAATPEASQTFAEALVGYAEERVDGLTQEARGDQLRIAEERYAEAEQAMLDAEQRVLDLQQERGILSAEVELSSQMAIINNLELEAENKRLALAEVLNNPRPNQGRVDVLRSEIGRLEARITELRGDLTQTSDSTVSLARIGGELRIAESALATRHMILQESIAAMEGARLEASRQVRYLSLGVAPVAPVEPTYPRKIENTILAFIVFMGIYIMVSLTVSILREQVSV